ncbi:LuxR C-terminal-related transcriptional regulator [Phaeobacter inhibens]|uniref:helix-turn-helix transcriptional regulator n=1 Tax=Phaeobacter inhibens TaxID=221822 RepID=UPI0026E1318E|nr:LuxR family transcriptional regulator [Phaeobacter inhibens]MDO6758028.1 LuxR C-terminal-related transcriptional regulator [Phaeobacter inhibens]
MNRELLEAAFRLETRKSLSKTWDIIVNVMAIHNIDRILYAVRDEGVDPNWFVLSNLPDQWPLAETTNADFHEPFVTYCCATFEVTKLGIAFLDQNEGYIDDYTREYVSNLVRFDWQAGLGIPCSIVGSGRYGGFVIGNNMARHGFERSVMPLADQLQAFSLIAHRKIESCRRLDVGPPRHRRLSAREYQVLELISSGHRPKTIAELLGLSMSSVRLYIKNARLKLGVATNEEAVIRFLQDHR